MYWLRKAYSFLVVLKKSFNVTFCETSFLGILSQNAKIMSDGLKVSYVS